MNILFVLRDRLEGLPPLLPRILLFRKLGHRVALVCGGISDENKKLLNESNINIVPIVCVRKKNNIFATFLEWVDFRKMFFKNIKALGKFDVAYICSADTALCLGKKITNKFRIVLQVNELYDKFPFYKRKLAFYFRNSILNVVPDESRSSIFRYWYNLPDNPLVVPNIPYIKSLDTKQTISNIIARQTLETISNKKIILYQGHISIKHRDFSNFLLALKEVDDDYAVLFMGRNHNKSFELYKSIFDCCYYIPFVNPPQHLEVTSNAYLGILCYNPDSLNNLFCAPNKVFEYSSYGIPMIGNDIIGLANIIEKNKLGVCVNFSDVEQVKNALNEIDKHYINYKQRSLKFFKDNEKTLILLVDEVERRVKNNG